MRRDRTDRFMEVRQQATAAMEKYQIRKGLQGDLFWAQLDTLCQTMPWVPRTEREGLLHQLWTQWMTPEIPDSLLAYYEGWMYAFFVKKRIRYWEYLYAQAGSLIAKLEWVDPANSGMTIKQMYNHCIIKMEQLPKFDRIPNKAAESSRNMLFNILKRYAAPDGMCSEQVRSFFLDNYSRYEQALQILMDKLYNTERETEKDAGTESLSQLDHRNKSTFQLENQEDEVIHSQDDMIGLCTFIEKTSSAVYQRSLSRLYALYQKPVYEDSGKYAQMYLRDFFSALSALGIEPVDEDIFKTEYPQEYSKELQRRSSDPDVQYTMAACGWSCNGFLVAYPVFYKNNNTGGR